MSGEKAKREAAGETTREAWGLLAGLVYPPPFLEVARRLELSPAAFMTLRILDQPRTMSEIATVLRCDNSNVTGIADVLEEKGLVDRRPAEHDRRVKLIALTPQGRQLRARLKRAAEKPPAWLAGLPAEDQRALRDILARASS